MKLFKDILMRNDCKCAFVYDLFIYFYFKFKMPRFAVLYIGKIINIRLHWAADVPQTH